MTPRDIMTITQLMCDQWKKQKLKTLHPIYKTTLSQIERCRFNAICTTNNWDFHIFQKYFHYIPSTIDRINTIYNAVKKRLSKKQFSLLYNFYSTNIPSPYDFHDFQSAIIIHSQNISVGLINIGSIVIFLSIDPTAGSEFRFPGHSKIIIEQLDGNFVKSMGIISI